MGIDKDEVKSILMFICNPCIADPECPHDEVVMYQERFMVGWSASKVLQFLSETGITVKSVKMLKEFGLGGDDIEGLSLSDWTGHTTARVCPPLPMLTVTFAKSV